MTVSKWVYLLTTGQFLRGGFYEPTFNASTEGVVSFPDADPHPDARLHRFDATTGKRPASQSEITAYDTLQADIGAQSDVAVREIKATVVWTLRRLLGRNPTLAEIETARTEWIAIYKQL